MIGRRARKAGSSSKGRDQKPRTVVSVTRELRKAVIGNQREVGAGSRARAQVMVEGEARAWAVSEKEGEVWRG